ncbi:uncharacterized protein LOC105686355 [Athalia rosae]|uniref:uncharacterized protein LOC105686355 n=1 Tax=Athalia rosae TaxID=37344 RepID=UPI002034071E|nr:uncharacterized protein LOC105686355 [Athalia rosae]
MNASRMMISLVRSYASQKRWKLYSKPKNPGIQRRLAALENDPENDVEAIEDLDLENLESDFMKAHHSYDAHKKDEAKSKELLKLRIVARKYFKDVQPSFLTYVEKEQIRFLHDSDPVEYTPEKLSESFPSLPGTIRKVLRARWTAKTADRVLKHDQHVIENWKKFKLGELPLEPKLREHLEKFRNRQISLPRREEIEEKLIPPPYNFPKPQSQLYSGLIRSYVDARKDDSSNKCLTENSENDSKIDSNIKHMDPKYSEVNSSSINLGKLEFDKRFGKEVAIIKDKKVSPTSNKKFSTLDEFLKTAVQNAGDTPSREDQAIMEIYKQNINLAVTSNNEIDPVKTSHTANKRLSLENTDYSNTKKFDSMISSKKDTQVTVEPPNEPQSLYAIEDSNNFALKTFVKERKNKVSDELEHYPETIVIPKRQRSKEKVYRLRDCYYDYDGEFLYRVPGLDD